MEIVLWIKQACEYLGGEVDEPATGVSVSIQSPFWGLWWGIALCIILAFSGQSSKFIYIDF